MWGGYENSVSLIEAIKKIEEISSIKQSFEILDKIESEITFVITQTLLKPSLIIRIGRQSIDKSDNRTHG